MTDDLFSSDASISADVGGYDVLTDENTLSIAITIINNGESDYTYDQDASYSG